MRTRRIILWVLSIGAGIAGMFGVILAFGSDFQRFQTGFLFIGDLPILLLFGFGSLAFIWLDLILQTEYLKK